MTNKQLQILIDTLENEISELPLISKAEQKRLDIMAGLMLDRFFEDHAQGKTRKRAGRKK